MITDSLLDNSGVEKLIGDQHLSKIHRFADCHKDNDGGNDVSDNRFSHPVPILPRLPSNRAPSNPFQSRK